MIALEQQSPDIAAGVHVNRREEDIGAGDQVMTRQVLPVGTLCRHVFGTRWRCSSGGGGAVRWSGLGLTWQVMGQLPLTRAMCADGGAELGICTVCIGTSSGRCFTRARSSHLGSSVPAHLLDVRREGGEDLRVVLGWKRRKEKVFGWHRHSAFAASGRRGPGCAVVARRTL